MKRYLAFVVLVLAAWSAAGEGEPRFFVERIEVRGLSSARPELVVTESRLEEGREYDESEIDEATWRVRRLPFVREAMASLEKGSERGRYVLVLEIDETLPFFVGVLEADDVDVQDDTGLFAGWRWFPGSKNVVHVAAILGDTDGVQLGFTRYGLLGAGSFLHLSLEYGLYDAVNEDDDGALSGELLLALPLGRNDALRFRARSEGAFLRGLDGQQRELREDSVGLQWVRDVTDDPFFPRRGLAASAGVEYTNREALDWGLSGTGDAPFDPVETEVEETAFVGSFVQYVPVGENGTLWGAARLRAGRNDWQDPELEYDREMFEGTLRAGWAGGPWNWMRSSSRNMRFEAGVVYGYERNNTGSGRTGVDREYAGFRLGFAFRNDWAVVRLVYEWYPHEDYH